MTTIIASFIVGLLLGLIQKGIHIHIHKEQPKITEEYNESLVDLMPPDVKNYYHSTNGQNKF